MRSLIRSDSTINTTCNPFNRQANQTGSCLLNTRASPHYCVNCLAQSSLVTSRFFKSRVSADRIRKFHMYEDLTVRNFFKRVIDLSVMQTFMLYPCNLSDHFPRRILTSQKKRTREPLISTQSPQTQLSRLALFSIPPRNSSIPSMCLKHAQ